MVKIGVIGAGGRMGRMLIQAVAQNPQTTLAGAIERQGSSLLGVDAGELVNLDKTNVALVDDLAGVIHDIDVLIDLACLSRLPKTYSFVLIKASIWSLGQQA